MTEIYKDVPALIFTTNPIHRYFSINYSNGEKDILRELGTAIAEIAALPQQEERKKQWCNLNDLKTCKPLVWINEVCWNEMDIDDELSLKTTSPFCRRIESELRQTLYQWNHMQGDMIVEPVIYAPLVIENSGIGIEVEEDTAVTDATNQVVSHSFHNQIKEPEDISKLVPPQITHYMEQSQENFEAYNDIFDGILTVKQRGVPGFWFAPWDDLITWTGVEQALLDLALRPQFIHRLMERIVSVYLEGLDQYETLELLSSNNSNVRIGSGAYGYTGELPEAKVTDTGFNASNIWGSATAQIFSEVSPAMHEKFALSYEKRWLERFGLSYYGCCEPLHNKIDILRSIPNLRKISISPWADVEAAAEVISGDFVVSLKPTPAVLAGSSWEPDSVRSELKNSLDILHRFGCNVEIIMKDISTVRYRPERLWEWSKIATSVCEQYNT